MKRKQALAVFAAVAMSMTLVGCTMPIGQVLDGDGMVFDPGTVQADPIKDSDGDDGNTAGTDNQNNGEGENNGKEAADDKAVYDAFLNNEIKAKFDHVISDEDDYYTFDEMVAKRGDEIIEFFDYEDNENEITYTTVAYSADIDCGNDGVKELGIRIEYSVDTGYEYPQTLTDTFILKNFEDELKAIVMTEQYYRSQGEINKYGVIREGGSGGAAMYVEIVSFVNADGELVNDYSGYYYMGYKEPTIPVYALPKYLREDKDIYEEEYATTDNYYTTNVYNFEKCPEYPENLVYDESGHYDEESQKRYEEYERDYDKWLEKNIYFFTDINDQSAQPEGEVKKFLDSHGIKYYSLDEADKLLLEHEKEIGITQEVRNGEWPEWNCLDGQGTSYNEKVEANYIGEFVDDYGDGNLQIDRGSDGKYIVQIGIGRLCFMDDGVGELYDDRMDFIITDDNGNPMEGNIVVDEKGIATITFTHSEWEYVADGDVFKYKKSSDTPNIFVNNY